MPVIGGYKEAQDTLPPNGPQQILENHGWLKSTIADCFGIVQVVLVSSSGLPRMANFHTQKILSSDPSTPNIFFFFLEPRLMSDVLELTGKKTLIRFQGFTIADFSRAVIPILRNAPWLRAWRRLLPKRIVTAASLYVKSYASVFFSFFFFNCRTLHHEVIIG